MVAPSSTMFATREADFFCHFVYVQHDFMRQLVDFGLDVFFCRIVGNVDEGGFIGHQPTFGAEVGR